MADLDCFANNELARAPIDRTAFALVHAADIGGEGPREIAARHNVAQVVVQLVRACNQVLSAFKRFVDHHRQAVFQRLGVGLQSDRSKKASRSAEVLR